MQSLVDYLFVREQANEPAPASFRRSHVRCEIVECWSWNDTRIFRSLGAQQSVVAYGMQSGRVAFGSLMATHELYVGHFLVPAPARVPPYVVTMVVLA